jgi:hypothetical protein
MMTQSKGGQGRGGGELDDNKGGERLEDECCRSCNARKFGARALKLSRRLKATADVMLFTFWFARNLVNEGS